MEQMQTPKTRAEFERRLYMLLENMRRGKLRFPPGMQLEYQLEKVRHLPNGRIDMLSIDEFVRLIANQLAQMESRMDDMEQHGEDEVE